MSELSPAAQAVFNSYLDNCDGAYDNEWYKGDLVMIAAALRAAADQVVPVPIKAQTSEEHWALLGVKNRLLAIADELEAK